MAQLPIYLVDFSCFSAPDELKVDYNKSQEAAWRWKVRRAGGHDIAAVCTVQYLAPARVNDRTAGFNVL
jgi:hypothetical protein